MPGPADTKDIRLRVIVDEDTRGAKRAADALDKTRVASDKLGDSLDDTAKDARSLDDELQDLFQKRATLIERYRETEDKDLLRERDSINKRIGLLKSFRNELAETARRAAETSSGIGSNVTASSSDLSTKPVLIGAAVAGAATALPALGAVLAGALSGTVVGGVMAGGILAASHDDRVRAAAHGFGEEISSMFFGGGTSFVRPVIESLLVLRQGFQDLHLDQVFAKVAPLLPLVAQGLADMATNIMPGLNALLDRAGPYTAVFADGLAGLGSALGSFLDNVSSSPGALEGLDAGMRILAMTVRILGDSLRVLSDTFHNIISLNAQLFGALEDIPGLPKPLRDTYAGLNDTFENILNTGQRAAAGIDGVVGAATTGAPMIGEFASENDLAAVSSDRLTRALSDQHGMFLTWMGSEIAAYDALDRLSESIKTNGKTFDINTEAGRNNLRTLRDVAVAGLSMVEAKAKEAHSVDEARKVYDDYRDQLIETLRQAGIGKKKAQELADKWLDVPRNVTTNYTIKEAIETFGSAPPGADRPAGKAAGGPVMAGVPYMINEAGRETVTFPASGRVHPASLTPLMAGGGTQVEVALRVMPGGADSFTRALVEMISRYVRIEGGGRAAALGIAA